MSSLTRIDRERRNWRRVFCAEASTLGLVAWGDHKWLLLALACLSVVLVLADLAADRWMHTR